MPACVRDADQIAAVRRSDEEELRVRADFSFALVVVRVVKVENRQSVRDQFCSRRVRLDNVALLLERVRGGGGVEPGAALSIGAVEEHV